MSGRPSLLLELVAVALLRRGLLLLDALVGSLILYHGIGE